MKMLTIKQFETLLRSYGGEIARWPQEQQRGAQQLLERSPQARALQEQARLLDDALRTVGARTDRQRAVEVDGNAALARLRAGVAARIAAERPAGGFPWAYLTRLGDTYRLGWLALTAAGWAAIASGLLLGSWYGSQNTPAPVDDSLLTALQPLPLHIPAE